MSPRTTPQPARVMIVDDHSLVAEGLSRLLESTFHLVAVVSRHSDVLPSIQASHPDVVLLDISMPGRSGVETARDIRKLWPNIKIIFLTMHSEAVYVSQAMGAGAHGYVLKGSMGSELIDAIHTVLAGGTFLGSSVQHVDQRNRHGADPNTASLLSPKQREVLELIAEGKADKEIATFMNISLKTVEFHKSSIRQRLGLTSTAQLTRFAVENQK